MSDVDITFESDEALEVVRLLIDTVQDGHVMREAIARADEYTGDRNQADDPARGQA